MHQFIAVMLALLTLSTSLLPGGGAQFTLTSNTPTHVYVQLDPEGGAVLSSPTIFELDMVAGETFARTIAVHGPGSVRVRVWTNDSGEAASADQVIALPTLRQYVALVAH
jgi:hypothetical protein